MPRPTHPTSPSPQRHHNRHREPPLGGVAIRGNRQDARPGLLRRFAPRNDEPTKGLKMRITQGTFSFLPDLTDDRIATQIAYCLRNGWAVNIEYTDDPHPRNTYWEMWKQPMFDLRDPAG